MDPSTVNTSDSFKATRNRNIVLNTQVESEVDVRNRFDRAVIEMFNVMHTNRSVFESGDISGYLAQGNIPAGVDSQQFADLLNASSSESLLIPFFHYPEWAQSRFEAQWGYFDPTKGLRVNFVEEYGFFDISWLAVTEEQIFGFTPRLTSENGLQIDLYNRHEIPPPHISDADMAEDVAATWFVNVIMQIMMITYGARDAYVGNAVTQDELLFNPPYSVNETISFLLSNKSVETGSQWNYGIANYSVLLDVQILT